MKAELVHDVARPIDLPPSQLPEVALVGRSNVGKSSLINAILGRRQLARTSGTPGKTRRIHFYRIEDRAHLVDLPGYGYAKVARTERASWRGLVEGYLTPDRSELRSVLLLVDIRREWRGEESELVEWVEAHGIHWRVVLTKADKLTRQRGRARRAEFARQLGLRTDDVACVSARTGAGLEVLGAWMREWLGIELASRRANPEPSSQRG